ncbi:hypothetical protein GGF46_002211 [Coemansia sp. RSA 552]|nr:hypothetical protein GGF46_002211 [Coemansia sp. RSA 552]
MRQLVDPTPAFGHDDDDNYSIASTDSGSSSSSSVTGIYDSGSGILVISTTEGFCDWIRQLAGPAAQPGIRWVVYSRLLPIESVVHSQAVLVCAPDAMHLLARLDVEHWASVAVDRTAIGSDVLSGMADLAATLKDVPTQYV